jgi:hypothetical protein
MFFDNQKYFYFVRGGSGDGNWGADHPRN